MKLTAVVCGPPKFHFWKDFGAGYKPRIPYYKYWWYSWRRLMYRYKIVDKTLPLDKLPPNSRVINAEDFMNYHPDLMPDEILERKNQPVVYNHPWPHQIEFNQAHDQTPVYKYGINDRFFVPRDDCQVLTNTILVSSNMEAQPQFEPTDNQVNLIQRDFDWSTRGDSVLHKLSKSRVFPKINLPPKLRYGLTKERMELNILHSFFETSRSILASHYRSDETIMNSILRRKALFFPHCKAPFARECGEFNLNLDLTIDHMSLDEEPLEAINPDPQQTRTVSPVDIKPRGWKSLLEKTRYYTPEWTFTLPRSSYPHTISLASRIVRDYRDPDEMLARAMIHSFGLLIQFARLKSYEAEFDKSSSGSKKSSVILEKPLEVPQVLHHPLVLQSIGYDIAMNQFHFLRYQLNTLDFDDEKPDRIKNQAWYSGPVTDIKQVLRHYLDYHAFGARIRVPQSKSAIAM